MESFLTTLPPYVHQYINKYPPTECFNILKDLICFAVLYSNNHERINLLSLELLQNGADNAVTHKPYTSSELVLSSPSLTPAPSTAITSPIQSTQHLSPASINKSIPSPSHSATHHHHSEQLDLECRTIMEEPGVFDEGTIVTPHVMNEPASTSGTALNPSPPHATHSGVPSSTVDTGRKSTMPYTFPEWWAHPGSDNHDHMGKNTTRSISPVSSSNEQQVTENNNINSRNAPKRLTTTQEVNITNWIPIDFEESTKKSTRNQTTTRPASLYNATIPDLRSYLARTEQKQQTDQANGSSKMTRQISVPAATLPCDPITPTISKSKPQPRQSLSTSRSSTPHLLTRSISSKTQTTTTADANINNNNKNTKSSSSSSGTPMALSRSSSTRSTASSSTTTTTMSSSAKAYRPGQTATVRARADQAKQRQLQLEEEKRKQAAASTLTSRTSLRLRQQAASGIDWDSIKKERRKTIPVSGL